MIQKRKKLISSIKRFLLLIGIFAPLFFLSNILSAQEMSGTKPPHFMHLITSDGLSQGYISAICQDQIGYIWIATLDGLDRYDGNSFKIYRNDPDSENSLSNNYILSMLATQDGKLWIGTHNGLNCLTLATNTFRRYTHDPDNPSSLSGKEISQIAQTPDGMIWVFSIEHSINRLDPQTGRVQRYDLRSIGTKNDLPYFIYALFVDSAGNLWALPQHLRNTILLYEPGQDTFVPIEIKENNLPEANFITISEDIDGKLLLSNGNQIIKYDQIKKAAIPFDSFNNRLEMKGSVIRILISQDGILYAGTNKGLGVYDRNQGKISNFVHNPLDNTSLIFNEIPSLFEDHSGVIWCGTNSNGISTYSPYRNKFSLYTSLPNSNPQLKNAYIVDVIEDQYHNIWLVCANQTVSWINRQTQAIKSFNLPEDGFSLVQDSQGNIWVGCRFGGIYLFTTDGKTAKPDHTTKINLKSIVTKMREDEQGNIVCLTSENGFFKIVPQGPNNYSVHPIFEQYNKDLYDSKIFQFAKNGSIWVGSSRGLKRFDQDTNKVTTFVHNTKDPASISNDNIMTIYESQDGTIWIGTSSGLNRFVSDAEGFIQYRQKDGLPNDCIYSILQDDKGNLWMGSNKGLLVFNPETRHVEDYVAHEGVQSNEFNHDACYQSSSGEMMFGGVQGLNTFYPSQIKTNQIPPPVVITSLKVLGQEIPFNPYTPFHKIHLRYTQNFLSFQFAALDFVFPKDNQYAYTMINFDKEWHFSGNTHSANYNLSPGNYVFRIKASNSDEVWNEKGTSLNIVITPPFWQTWSFRILVFLLIALIIFGIVRMRNRLIRAKNRELSLLNSDLMDEITKRETTEKELRKSEERYRCVVDNANDVVWRMDMDGRILFISPSVKKVAGYDPQDLIGEKIEKVLQVSEIAKVQQSLENRKMGILGEEGIILNLSFQKKDGSFLVGETMTTPVFGPDGSPLEIIGITRDITERISLEEQLRQSQKMEAVGLLAGGIAHDFNNLLTGILGYSEMLMRKLQHDSPYQRHLEEIHKAGEKAASLTYQLLAYSRKQILEPKILHLNDLIQEMEKMLGRIIREDITLEYTLEPNLSPIKADPIQIEQIIMNLVLNARDAIDEKGLISIQTRNACFKKKTRFIHDEIDAGHYVELSIQDTGCGIQPEVLSQVFEPFFTTKELGKGTGLGLSTVFGIVKQSGGSIRFESTPKVGSHFSIFFPVVVETESNNQSQIANQVYTQGDEVIVLVEDSNLVKTMVKKILEDNGYTILVASCFSDLCELLNTYSGKIDLLLTDVVLPQKNGREIAEFMQNKFPSLKVLYMSGHTEDEILRKGILTHHVNFIHKPFSAALLLKRIREILHPESNEEFL